MSNLVRKNNSHIAPSNEGVAVDPFRMMNALFRWDPFRSFIDDSWVSPASEFSVRFDLKETNDAYLAKVDLPGVKEEDIDIAWGSSVCPGLSLTPSSKKRA